MGVRLKDINFITLYTDKKDHNEGLQKDERIAMNTCGAYNLVAPKSSASVVTEENPAYATISLRT